MTFTHNIIRLVLFLCFTNTWAHSQVDFESNNFNEGDLGVKLLDDSDVYLTLFKNNLPGAPKVHIQIYYESLDMACSDFCFYNFARVVKTMGQYLDIQLYPFGKAKVIDDNGKLDFKCRHGPDECYGNKLHACALDKLQHNIALIYNICLMNSTSSFGSDDESADMCGKLMGIDSEPIKECAKGTRGTELLLYYGEESKKANFSYVPHVLINGKMSNTIVYDIKPQVCDAFTNPPPPCKNG